MTRHASALPVRETGAPFGRADIAAALRGMGTAALDQLNLWLSRWRERQALARMDERLLRDIGIDRSAAAAEARKPFWQ